MTMSRYIQLFIFLTIFLSVMEIAESSSYKSKSKKKHKYDKSDYKSKSKKSKKNKKSKKSKKSKYDYSYSYDYSSDSEDREDTHPPTQSPTPCDDSIGSHNSTSSLAPSTSSFICDTTENIRASKMMEIFESVSDSISCNTPNSPQNFASNALIADITRCHTDGNLIEVYSLAVFYFAMNGDNWEDCSRNANDCGSSESLIGQRNFLSPGSPCNWFGVTCDNSNLVWNLVFENNNLVGAIPSEMEQLSSLEVLQIEHEGVVGTIPSEIGNLGSLRILDLDFNSITGTIPEEIFSVITLQQLDVNNNKLTGTLSSAVGNLIDLRLIQLYENSMTGTIPSELGLCSDLIVAEFFDNDITGTMPTQVCSLRTPPIGSGLLTGLTSDCALSSSGSPQIQCECCSACVA